MARSRKNADDVQVGPMDERDFKSFLKRLDLAQVEVEEASDAVKAARSELSSLWKEFKKAGGKADTMREVMNLRRMDENDLIQHEEDRRRYADWMKLPLYAQPDMFEEDPPRKAAAEEPDPAPKTRRAAKPAPENVTGSPLN